MADRMCEHFLASPCLGVGKANDRPVPFKFGSVSIGKKSTHHTHALYTFKGMVYCNTCGMRCLSKLHNLSRECRPPTAYGRETFKAIAEGHLPEGPLFQVSKLGRSVSQHASSRTTGAQKSKILQSVIQQPPKVQSQTHHSTLSNSSDDEDLIHPVLRTYSQIDFVNEGEVLIELHSSSSGRKRQNR